MTGLPSTLWHTLDFGPATGRYVRIYVTKSRLSGGGLYYARIAEIEVYETTVTSGQVTLSWTAPGDDGAVGTAAAYDVRYSASAIVTESDFLNATPVANPPPPSPAGSSESFAVSGLTPGSYHFVLKAIDDAGNPSALSNDVSISVQ